MNATGSIQFRVVVVKVHMTMTTVSFPPSMERILRLMKKDLLEFAKVTAIRMPIVRMDWCATNVTVLIMCLVAKGRDFKILTIASFLSLLTLVPKPTSEAPWGFARAIVILMPIVLKA